MTDMKRISVSMTDEIVAALEELRQTDEFKGRPYSYIIRTLLNRGLDLDDDRRAKSH